MLKTLPVRAQRLIDEFREKQKLNLKYFFLRCQKKYFSGSKKSFRPALALKG